MNQQNPIKVSSTEPDAGQNSPVNWLQSHFLPQYGKKVLAGVIVVGLISASLFYVKGSIKQKDQSDNKSLGTAFIYISTSKMDSAEIFLENFLTSDHSDFVVSKACLLLGKSQYMQGKWDKAMASYKKVKSGGHNTSLLSSGALHGIAACHMQKQQYAEAVKVLDLFLKNYMKRTGNLEDRALGKEPVDLSPAVSNVLWKLALCHFQLKQKNEAIQACDKLIGFYGDSEEAEKARRFLPNLKA